MEITIDIDRAACVARVLSELVEDQKYSSIKLVITRVKGHSNFRREENRISKSHP